MNKNSKGIYFILPGCSQDGFFTGYIAITFQVAGVCIDGFFPAIHLRQHLGYCSIAVFGQPELLG